jgi:soluble lytic murein transglycosylase-like protein
MHILSLALSLVILACASGSSSSTSTGESSPSPDRPLSTTLLTKDNPEYSQTEVFDKFVRHALTAEEETLLRGACKTKTNNNPFCYAVNNFDRFERQLKSREFHAPSEKKIPPPVMAQFNKKGKVTNWRALRSAEVPNLLRGLLASTPSEIQQLKALALKEKRCPNNISVSLAATLEDKLPTQDVADLAKLDEKGGDCAKNPADREAYYARAGLFYYVKKDLKNALRAFQKGADSEGTFVGRSLFWLHRTEDELGDTKASNITLEEMKSRYPFSFHTVAALISAGKDPGDLLQRAATPSFKRSKSSTAINQLVIAVELLRKYNFEFSADRALDYAILNSSYAEPEMKMYLGELKKDGTDHSAKLQMMSEVLFKNSALVSKATLELYFPKLFAAGFEKNPAGVDPFLLMAVARQESLFNPKAISPASAYGLMQIQPATAKRFGVNLTSELEDPTINIQAGSKLINELMKNLNGQVQLVLASYNAGTDRVSTWLTRYPTADPILFMDLIPYRETRDYVANVLRNYYWYRRIYGQSSSTVKLPKIFEFAAPNRG